MLGEDGKFLRKWATKGDEPGQLDRPHAVAIDSKGNLYVASHRNSRIQKFDPQGKLLLRWDLPDPGKSRSEPTAIHFDKQDRLFVPDTGNHRILVYDTHGKLLTKFGKQGKGDGQFNRPNGLALDDRGFLYVCDSGNQRIQKFKLQVESVRETDPRQPKPKAQTHSKDNDAVDRPQLKAVLVQPKQISRENTARWKKEGFGALVVLLDEAYPAESYAAAVKASAEASLDLYYWIEVGRNPRMADEHPRWMASFGGHKDWLALFPKARAPTKGESAKVYPWVPIGYQESFDAHLVRIKGLLKRAGSDYRGLLLNDLQGSPASCGCPNPQCRWALDYGVASTATKIGGYDVAAKFLARVQELAPGKVLAPIWATECEEVDAPARSRKGQGDGTGLCASVGCVGGCPKFFTQRWIPLYKGHKGPIGVLLTHKELGRDHAVYKTPAGWIPHALEYLDRIPPKFGGEKLPRDRLWAVIQGYDVTKTETDAALRAAAKAGVAAVVVARTRIDQSFEPRIISVEKSESNK